MLDFRTNHERRSVMRGGLGLLSALLLPAFPPIPPAQAASSSGGRMSVYTSLPQARAELARHFEAEEVERLLGVLQATIGFDPLVDVHEAPLGATRLGGAPDLSLRTPWPIRDVPANLDEIAARGGSNHRETLEKALRRPTPYAFIAQIDLAEAATLGTVSSSLPAQGRLLFFYGIDSGPWNDGRDTCRVVWDTGPQETLVRQPVPQILQDLRQEQAREWNDSAARHGLDPMPETHSPYWGPPQPLRLVSGLRLPALASIEAVKAPGVASALEAYEDILSDFEAEDGLSRMSLLGSPLPEQDDPRYNAVILERFAKPFLSAAEWKEAFPAISREAANWRLLLQVDLAAWLRQPYVEGTVYFLISRADLDARAFDRTVAIYQQT